MKPFINHFGYALLPNWHSIERNSHFDKQNAILKKIGLSIDKGQRPFQTLHELFNARNELAHGKPHCLLMTLLLNMGRVKRCADV
jgi:hypothetical protein